MNAFTTAQGKKAYYQYDAASNRLKVTLSLGKAETQPMPAMPGITLHVETATQEVHGVTVDGVRNYLPNGEVNEAALQNFAAGLVDKMLKQ